MKMPRLLFLIGFVLVAGGAAMITFGIPINEFGLGNTLIGAGTTAIVGGLLLTGIAALLRELIRVRHVTEERAALVATDAVAAHRADAASAAPDTAVLRAVHLPEPARLDGEPVRRRRRTVEPIQAMAQDTAPPARAMVRAGAVDGVAYSLYSDGSIDADFPQGRMQFGSLEELQAYLQTAPQRSRKP